MLSRWGRNFWRIVQKEHFNPGLLGIFINPFYFARKGLYLSIKALAPHIKGKTLDVGCGLKPYEGLFDSTAYIGLEIDSPENRKNKKAEFFYDGNHFPFQSNEFDSLVANQVLEHVFNPDDFLSEIIRVLKIGGNMLLTVPFVWDEHDQPFDYARYSSFGLKHLLEKHGFEVIESRKTVNDVRLLFQLFNEYVYKVTRFKNPYADLFATVVIRAPFHILGELIYRIFPKNNDLYLDNVVLARKGRSA